MPDGNGQALSVQNKIPDLIRVFLTSKKNIEKCVELAGKHQLTGKEPLVVSRILNKIYFGEVGFIELPRMLEMELKIAPEAAKKIALDYAGYELLPISSYLGDVDSFIRLLGGNPSNYPAERIIMREQTPSDLITEFLHDHPVMVPAHLEHRLREILESRVRGVRKDDETATRLTRAEKIGGVELPREEAEKLIEALAAKIASVKIAPDNEAVAVVSAPTAIPVEAKAPDRGETSPGRTRLMIEISPQSAKSGHGFTPADEHEANIIREKVLPKVVSSAVFGFEEEVRTGTEAVLDATNTLLSVSMLERYKAIVTSRLKGVRDAAEIRDLLLREAAKGGMGFSVADADASMLLIEKQVMFVNGKREETIKSEKSAFIKNSVDATLAKDESRKKGELEELDRMYGSLTGKVSKTRAPEQKLGAEQAPPPAPPIPVRVPAPTPASVPTPTVPQPVFRTPITPPVPRPLPPSIAPTTPAPMAINQQPTTRMHDVRPAFAPAAARQLTGPVQELANLTLTDFRRLGADPNEACRKLSDKLDILEEHSYGARIAGIQAWQESEVYKRYLQTINAAFSGGKPIATAIADNLAAGRETLTEREVRAIMELNRQLKA